MPSTLPAPIDKLAIVVVTYKRQELLANLFDSMTELTATPWRIVIVDNENSRETEAMCTAFNERLASLWGIDTEQPDAQGGTDRVIYAPQLENGGGAGGFSAGTKCAYDLGAQWFWVMDDDVLVIPEGIERLAKWTDRYDVIQGSRLDFDGGAFFWQYQLILSLGIPNPIAKWDLGPEGYRTMNQLCFEGGMFSRRVVDKIGLPDARFFIYGDDACYGNPRPALQYPGHFRARVRARGPRFREARPRRLQLGYRRQTTAQLHERHQPLLHHAQPRLPRSLYADLR